ncbi:zinc finger protein VAR3, chloroplastic-like [Primulina huaijiensis]|uniref:zinc finger protein VAR3, chloroplastic-like n=1 Tax=Primulina huaijiensis TaxID=1492673 RepID=UPI003CC6F319
MGGATRFITLLVAPFPLLRPSILLLLHRLLILTTSPLLFTLSSPYKTKSRTSHLVSSFHSQPNNNAHNLSLSATSQQQHNHPWPEWTHFLNFLSDRQALSSPSPVDLKIPPEDAFVVYEELPDDFVIAASNCLAFARDRPNLLGLLSRKNIEAVVSNGTPFLFKSALDCARRMRAFLGTDQGNASEYDKATTIDLMKYIISYVSNPTVSSSKNGLYSRELVDSSIRNLLHELGTVSGAPIGYAPAQEQQFSGRYGQTTRPLGRNTEMKKGDWVCSKCNFMNFARNMECLECEEPRPKRQLTGGEWECPQCNFFNYGRNLVCLRCDCRRPGAPLFKAKNSGSGLRYNGDYQFKANIDSRLVENEGEQNRFSEISPLDSDVEDLKILPMITQGTISTEPTNQGTVSSEAQSFSGNFQFPKDSGGENKVFEQSEMSENWFKKVVDLYDDKDLPSTISDEDFPAMMPMRKGENRFVVTKKKDCDLYDDKDLPSTISDEDFPAMMPMRKGENRFVVTKKKDRSLTSPKYKRQVALDQAKDSNFVPFVPFPPDYFARKDTEQPGVLDTSRKATSDNSSHKVPIETENFDGSRHIAVPTKDDRTVSAENSVYGDKFMVDTSTDPKRVNSPTSTESSQLSDNIITPSDSSPDQSSITSHSISNNSGKPKMSEYENVRSSWMGKSLEGSAVKELDPLDMSEEAKAERWFKRVAQVKDISELSQIPDEDFPSIMPMRKGVNRFVVSKRKTPLERRLTSQQYRRSLPIVITDPVRNETDNSS